MNNSNRSVDYSKQKHTNKSKKSSNLKNKKVI